MKRHDHSRVGANSSFFAHPPLTYLGCAKEKEAMKDSEHCSCVTDPFGALPPELQPRLKEKGSLRRVKCSSCGKGYWTNRETDLCIDCERASVLDHGPRDSK